MTVFEQPRESYEQAEPEEPCDALGVQREMRLDEGGIENEREQRADIGQGIEAVRDFSVFDLHPPDLEKRARGGEHDER